MIEKTCQSSRLSQWCGDTLKVSSSKLQELICRIPAEKLEYDSIMQLLSWKAGFKKNKLKQIPKKSKEKHQPLNKLTEKTNTSCTANRDL